MCTAANLIIEGRRLCTVGRKLTTLAFIVFEWVKIIALKLLPNVTVERRNLGR